MSKREPTVESIHKDIHKSCLAEIDRLKAHAEALAEALEEYAKRDDVINGEDPAVARKAIAVYRKEHKKGG